MTTTPLTARTARNIPDGQTWDEFPQGAHL